MRAGKAQIATRQWFALIIKVGQATVRVAHSVMKNTSKQVQPQLNATKKKVVMTVTAARVAQHQSIIATGILMKHPMTPRDIQPRAVESAQR